MTTANIIQLIVGVLTIVGIILALRHGVVTRLECEKCDKSTQEKLQRGDIRFERIEVKMDKQSEDITNIKENVGILVGMHKKDSGSNGR